MSRAERPPDDLLTLREIQSALGLELFAQIDVGQGEVVAHALVVRVGDLDRHVRDSSCEAPWSCDHFRAAGDTAADNDRTKHPRGQPSPTPSPDIPPSP